MSSEADGSGTDPAQEGAEPFLDHVGIRILDERDGTALAYLPHGAHLAGLGGTLHAAALFALGQAAAHHAAAGVLGGAPPETSLLLRQAEVSWRRPASGAVTAHAGVIGESRQLLDDLAAYGRSGIEVAVRLEDSEHRRVGELTVEWTVRTGPERRAPGV